MLLNKYLSDDNSLDKEMLDNIDKYLQNFYNKIPKFGWDPRSTLYNIWLKVEIF